MYERQDKPNFLVYVAYLGVYIIALNTVYLVLPNDHLRWSLIGILVVAAMTGFILSARHYVLIGLALDIAGLAVFIYYGWRIYEDRMAFGTYLGEMLSAMLVLRCFKLFRYQDFLLPLVISLTLMVFASIPSFSAEFVYSLLGYLLLLGLALFLGSVDEFARLPGRKTRRSRWEYTYDFLEEYAPVPVSKKTPRQLARFIGPALRASIPAVLLAFGLSSAFYFTVDHTYTPGAETALLAAFGGGGLEEDTASEADLLTGGGIRGTAQYYTGFDTEFNIAQGRLLENSTSTDPVMEVSSNLPSYWRGKCFDTYTGRGWVQSEEVKSATWSLASPKGQQMQYHGTVDRDLQDQGIEPDPQIYKDEIRQVYYLNTTLPGIMFTAYQPLELSAPVPGVLIDDTFTINPPPAADSMVAGQHYEVVSRKFSGIPNYLVTYDYDPAKLKEDSPEFYSRYTRLPERQRVDGKVTGYDFTRVRAKAFEVTAGRRTVFEKVHALESFLRSRYRFSTNPPSAVPPEQDAVTYFLFNWEPRRGHCEYFSTSLAVLCRSIGIPARVVTGYATGNYNFLKNRYIVQERHAHAWVEIFWPDIGWVEFDPTPQTWYEGIGGKTSAGWLVFHNAVENLYVYDPRGYFRDKIIPAGLRAVTSMRIFLNQRELDFYETVDPVISMTEKNREGPLWMLSAAFAVLLASFYLRRALDRDWGRRQAMYVGIRGLQHVRRALLRRGVNPILLATETDVAIQAGKLSDAWGRSVSRLTEAYQSARYSPRKVTLRDVTELRRASRSAARIPRS